MAPSSSFDYYYQTLENARFFSRSSAEICIVTAKEPLGKWRAIVLRGEKKHREVLLSETGSSVLESLQLLHSKSAEAVQNHISTYGFDYVRGFKKHTAKTKKRSGDNNSDDESDSGVYSSGSESSILLSDIVSNASLSDDDSESVIDDDYSGKSKSRKGRKDSKSSNGNSRRRNRSRSSSPVRDPGPPMRPRVPHRGPHVNSNSAVNLGPPAYARPASVGQSVPPPPSGWAIAHTQGPTNGASRPGMRFPSPPAMPVGRPAAPGAPAAAPAATAAAAIGPQKNIRLHITWVGHGDIKIFDTSAASRRSIMDTALAYLRGHTSSFANVTPMDNNPGRLWNLKATLKQALFGTESYDMSGYPSDDLTRLFDFAGEKDIPLFEVEIAHPRPMGPPGPPVMRVAA